MPIILCDDISETCLYYKNTEIHGVKNRVKGYSGGEWRGGGLGPGRTKGFSCHWQCFISSSESYIGITICLNNFIINKQKM